LQAPDARRANPEGSLSLYLLESGEKLIFSVWRKDLLKYFSLAKFDHAQFS